MKIKQLFSVAFAAAVIAGFTGHANAIPFDFRSFSSNFQSEMTFSNGDVSVTITAASNNGTPKTVYQGPLGLGVQSSTSDNLEIDGDDPKEVLTLTFNQPVSMNDIWFGLVDLNDAFKLWVDGKLRYNADIPGWGIIQHVDTLTDLSLTTEEVTGSVFEFTVRNPFDDYKLVGVDVSKSFSQLPPTEDTVELDEPTTSTTPEPVTATLGLIGLGGLVMATRRRRGR